MDGRLLRSDDSVRRVRAMWLGSGALRWPVDWTFVEWGIALACAAAIVPVVGLLAALVIGPLGGILWGVGLGGWLSLRLFQRLRLAVDHDQPVRWWLDVIRHELRGGRPAPAATLADDVVATWRVPVDEARRAELAARTSRERHRSSLAAPDTWWRRRSARRELARGVRSRLEAE